MAHLELPKTVFGEDARLVDSSSLDLHRLFMVQFPEQLIVDLRGWGGFAVMLVSMVMMVGMMVGMVARGPDSDVLLPPAPPKRPREPGDELDEEALVGAGMLIVGPDGCTLNVCLACEVLAHLRSEPTLVLAVGSPRSSQHPDVAALLREVDLLTETAAVARAPPPPPLSRGGVPFLLASVCGAFRRGPGSSMPRASTPS